MGQERFNRVCQVALAATLLSACEGMPTDESAPPSDRGGIGVQMPAPTPAPTVDPAPPPPPPLDIRRSLAVTEKNILARFGARRVFTKLATDLGGGATPEKLFRQLWDTQNPAPGQPDLPGMAHCSDNGNTLNGFPYVCRPSEGRQAQPDSLINLDSYAAVGLYNRFDLAPVDGSHCGEYRIVLARLPSNPGNRNFMNFEAVLPNPQPELGLEGCRPVANFWAALSSEPDALARASKLESFYFTGLNGFSAVVSANNYGNNLRGLGQVRTNQFLSGGPNAPPVPWMLREYKLVNGAFVPATVKTNPFGGLFNPASPDARASDFQNHFLTQVASLALNDLNRFTWSVPDTFNSGQSDSQGRGIPDDYLAQFGPGPSAFHQAIGQELARIGSPLTPHDVVARAQALSCGGCHQRNSGRPVGGGLTWPASANFVHSTELDDPADPGRFSISPALRDQFLPRRKQVLESFLQAAPAVTASVTP